MANFMFVYRGGDDGAAEMSPEQLQGLMQKWNEWIGAGMGQGWMVDPGDALLPESCVVDPQGVVTDGPFVEAKEVVGGYTVVQAETLAAAAEHAKGCPVLLTGGRVEVRPLAGLKPS